jgi:hypothetical protein
MQLPVKNRGSGNSQNIFQRFDITSSFLVSVFIGMTAELTLNTAQFCGQYFLDTQN